MKREYRKQGKGSSKNSKKKPSFSARVYFLDFTPDELRTLQVAITILQKVNNGTPFEMSTPSVTSIDEAAEKTVQKVDDMLENVGKGVVFYPDDYLVICTSILVLRQVLAHMPELIDEALDKIKIAGQLVSLEQKIAPFLRKKTGK